MTVRFRQLSGLGSGSDSLVELLDNIPLVSTAKARSIVRDFEVAVQDAAESRVRERIVPEVESAVKKGIAVSVGISALIGFVVWRSAGR